jgi:hypothetical protein
VKRASYALIPISEKENNFLKLDLEFARYYFG